MKRDSIFYRLFQQSPALIFDLLANPPANARAYRFEAIAVKEPKFEIDGVFTPPDTDPPGTVFFGEVQFQKDNHFYERLFGEAFLFFYRHRDAYTDWQAVIIYPSRSVEQDNIHPYRALLNSDQVHRIYLDELGDIEQLPLGVALMVLTTVPETQAPDRARRLLDRAEQEASAPRDRQAIIEMITTIMVYKFTNLSRQEVETMLGIQLADTRVYREAKEEGRQEGVQQGLQQGEATLIVRQLQRRLGTLDAGVVAQIQGLPIAQLEALGEALLEFKQMADLVSWLTPPT